MYSFKILKINDWNKNGPIKSEVDPLPTLLTLTSRANEIDLYITFYSAEKLQGSLERSSKEVRRRDFHC